MEDNKKDLTEIEETTEEVTEEVVEETTESEILETEAE